MRDIEADELSELEDIQRQSLQEERVARRDSAAQTRAQENEAQQALRTAPEGEVTAGIA